MFRVLHSNDERRPAKVVEVCFAAWNMTGFIVKGSVQSTHKVTDTKLWYSTVLRFS